MKKLFYLVMGICFWVGCLHAEASIIQLKRDKNYPEISLRIDHPLGWVKKEVPYWDLVFEKQESKHQIGIHFFRDQGFNIEDVSDIINHFDHLCEALYTSKRDFLFYPANEQGMASCTFVGKTKRGEEVCTIFLTGDLCNTGIITTWMCAGEQWEKMETEAASLLYPSAE